MKVLIQPDDRVFSILGENNCQEFEPVRAFQYVRKLEDDKIVLLFNVLTRELLALSPEEEKTDETKRYLKDHWFLVREDFDDFKLAGQVRNVISLITPECELNSFTIFTTTDCNARCFYCFEKGCKPTDMSIETADAVIDYIIRNCAGKEAELRWFGGEPLLNKSVIDHICLGLQDAGKQFKSSIVTNGYLFDAETIEESIRKWNLEEAHITLDGTEEIYNRTKNYVKAEESPYRVVKKNIKGLLDAGIKVRIRLNLGRHNAKDLIHLIHELSESFAGNANLVVYVIPLYEQDMPEQMKERWRKEIYASLEELQTAVKTSGLSLHLRALHYKLPSTCCMADSRVGITILPDGRRGICDHYTDREILGDVFTDSDDEGLIEAWREKRPPIQACRNCVRYPECVIITHCPEYPGCFEELRQHSLKELDDSILHEYYRLAEKSGKASSDSVSHCGLS